ncbi:MAG: VanZ family protein [Marinobacter sp.]
MRLQQAFDRLISLQPLWRALFCFSLMTITWLGFTIEPYPIPSAASDKINHMLAFLVLAMLARLGWPMIGHTVPLVVLAGYGMALELGQTLTPWRQFSLFDVLADVTGILAGFALLALILKVTGARLES